MRERSYSGVDLHPPIEDDLFNAYNLLLGWAMRSWRNTCSTVAHQQVQSSIQLVHLSIISEISHQYMVLPSSWQVMKLLPAHYA